MPKDRWQTRSARALCVAGGCKSVEIAIEKLVARARATAMTGYLEPTLARPPYDPIPLAYSLGAKEIRAAPLDVEGHLIAGQDGLILEYNNSAIPRRQRFTIAHEVGHLLLWSVTNRISKLPVRRMGRGSEVEELCNKIAAEVLAPKKEVHQDWASVAYDLENRHTNFILNLSHKFDISISFAALRYRDACVPKAGVGLVDLVRERFTWCYGVSRPDWLRELAITKYKTGSEFSGSDSYATGSERYVRQRGFEWQRLNDRSLLVVVH